MHVDKQNGLTILLCVLGYMLLLASSSNSLLPWFGSFVLLMYVFVSSVKNEPYYCTPVSLAAIAFSVLILVHQLVHADLITAADRYPGFFMVLLPLLGLVLEKPILEKLFRYLVLIFCLLSIWAIVQHYGGLAILVDMGGRANTFFTTPNSFAAALNLVLVLLVSIYAGGRTQSWILPIIMLLFAALLVTESRGGWLAFAATLVIAAILFRVSGSSINKAAVTRLSIGILSIFFIYSAITLSGYDDYLQRDNKDKPSLEQTAERYPLTSRSSSIEQRLYICRYLETDTAVTMAWPWLYDVWRSLSECPIN